MGKIYAAIAAAFGLIATIFVAYFKGGQAKKHEIKGKTEEAARKQQQASSNALVDGLEKEQEVRNEEVDADSPRDHFH